MTVPTNIRFNLNAPFPSLVTGTGPITVGKQNGIWTVGFNTANLAVQNPPPPTSLATDYVLVYDSVAKQYINVPLSNFTPMVLLNVLTANNSGQLIDTTSISTAYQDYILAFENILPVNNAVHLVLELQSAGIFQITNYLNSAGGVITYIDVTQGANLGNNATWGYSGILRLFNANSNNVSKMVSGVGGYLNNTGTAINSTTIAAAWFGGTSPITGFKVVMTTGNISSGTIKVYGTV